jgi:hypothetical protein
LITKLVEFVADVLVAKVAPTLVGVLALPVSSNSTVKEKFWEGGVMVAVISVAERVAVTAPIGPKVEQGVLVPPTVIPPKPAGKDAVSVSTHHS